MTITAIIPRFTNMGTVKPPVSPSMTKIITNLKKLITNTTAQPLSIQQNTNITKMVVIPGLTKMGMVKPTVSPSITKMIKY